MRKQWPCSKCGFACSSTWRSLNTSKPVICNTCRSKEGKNKVLIDPNPPTQIANEGAKVNLLENSSFAQISSSTSVMNENVAISVSQIGMIFGNLPFEPTLTLPVILHGKSQEPNIKTEVVNDGDDCANGFQNHFYSQTSLKSSTTSVLGDGRIQIKQEYDCEQTLPEVAKQSIWDTNKVQKKKRSKLPQYTLSPLARFINQLQHVSCYGGRPYLKTKSRAVTGQEKNEPSKYDDVLIYEKCKYVAENEIGLGAKLVSSSSVSLTKSTVVIKEESSSTDESGAYFQCLIDVPIKSGASE